MPSFLFRMACLTMPAAVKCWGHRRYGLPECWGPCQKRGESESSSLHIPHFQSTNTTKKCDMERYFHHICFIHNSSSDQNQVSSSNAWLFLKQISFIRVWNTDL